jgi:hypothetical protein
MVRTSMEDNHYRSWLGTLAAGGLALPGSMLPRKDGIRHGHGRVSVPSPYVAMAVLDGAANWLCHFNLYTQIGSP